MLRELWKFSIPNRAARTQHSFEKTNHTCSITFDFERYPGALPVPPGSILRLTLNFTGVIEYKVVSEDEQDAEMIRVASQVLVDVGESAWLAQARLKHDPDLVADLRHLMIGFIDDGKCYQFICASYSIAEGPSPEKEVIW